jgi:hypothetical protein
MGQYRIQDVVLQKFRTSRKLRVERKRVNRARREARLALGEEFTRRLERELVINGQFRDARSALDELIRATRSRRAASFLDTWGIILPARVFNEELGDYIEDISRRAARGQRVKVYLRVAAAIFWTALNSIGYAMKQLGKKQGT